DQRATRLHARVPCHHLLDVFIRHVQAATARELGRGQLHRSDIDRFEFRDHIGLRRIDIATHTKTITISAASNPWIVIFFPPVPLTNTSYGSMGSLSSEKMI